MKIIHILLFCLLATMCACSGKKNSQDISIKTAIIEYDAFGGMVLSINKQDMEQAGFTPGDIVTVELADTTLDVPYFTGYFSKLGDLLLVDYPNEEHTNLTASGSGIDNLFPHMEGDSIRITLKEKGGAKDIEKTLGMQYSNNRADYESDNVFANAREIKTTGIAPGKFFRTASPFDNTFSRAPYVSAFLQENGVRTALNLTDDAQKLQSYSEIPAYSQELIDAGNVVFCKVDANYRSESFNKTLVSGLIELMNHPAPYVVHCTEGKDRTGYVCALLEGLAGASYDDIAADYLVTYYNYFHITPENDAKACALLLQLRLNDALQFFCNVDSDEQLRTIDLSEALQQYLQRYGMEPEQVQQFIAILK